MRYAGWIAVGFAVWTVLVFCLGRAVGRANEVIRRSKVDLENDRRARRYGA